MASVRECTQCGETYVPANGPCPCASFLPSPTPAERIKAEQARKARKGSHEPCDVGLFSTDAQQTDLVDLARKEPNPP